MEHGEGLGRCFAEVVAFEVRVGGEVYGGERNVAEETGADAFVQPDETQVPHDPEGATFGQLLALARRGFERFALDLQPDLDDLEGVREDDLAHTRAATRQNLEFEGDGAAADVGEFPAHEVVDSQLDGFFGRDADELGEHAGVETAEAFVADDFLEAVDAVFVHEGADASGALILHAGLDEVDGVDHEGAEGTGDAAEGEVVGGDEEVLREAGGLRDGEFAGRGQGGGEGGGGRVPGCV